jgi:DNA-binding transcriptional ArsR family regulator
MRKKMPETEYRASRICRVLGNPTAYQILKLLLKKKKTPSQIANELKVSLSLVSRTLRILRNINIVRYETKGIEKIYWVKDDTVLNITELLEKFVKRMRKKNW